MHSLCRTERLPRPQQRGIVADPASLRRPSTSANDRKQRGIQANVTDLVERNPAIQAA
jgi:hypothetical protein